MKLGFQDNSFAFEFVRNLGFMYYGGSDLGDMMATAATIKEGDFESWFTGWHARADKLQSRADASSTAGHFVSAREQYLHASTYFRMAEFYLHGNPGDPRILSETRASQKAYAKAAELTGATWERIEIPYEGTTLPGYFYKVDDSGEPRPTLIFTGGYDSSIEEMFYYGGAPAIRRGYNCLTFDGPGQGAPVRMQGLYFRHDWENVITPVVDYALSRSDVDGDNLALLGMSLGGYLAARAVAFEHRFKAVIYFDGVYSFFENIKASMPKEGLEAFEARDSVRGEEIVYKAMQTDTTLRWNVTQGVWTFGVSSFAQFYEKTKLMTLDGVAGQIKTPSLIMEAEGDIFFLHQPEMVYNAIDCPKLLYHFTAEDGAENHCQSGALSYKDEVMFNWLDETMNLNHNRKP